MTQKQIKHVDAYGTEIKVGDVVKISYPIQEGRYDLPSFRNSWNYAMTEELGKTKKVICMDADGVYLNPFTYPSFCLEVVDEEQIIEDKLQEELSKVFGGDESKMLREYYRIHYKNLE